MIYLFYKVWFSFHIFIEVVMICKKLRAKRFKFPLNKDKVVLKEREHFFSFSFSEIN